MPLFGFGKILTEPRLKGSRLISRVKMRNIPESVAAEIRLSLLSPLCYKSSDRRRQRDKAVPQKHGRDIKNMRKYYALNPKWQNSNTVSLFSLSARYILFSLTYPCFLSSPSIPSHTARYFSFTSPVCISGTSIHLSLSKSAAHLSRNKASDPTVCVFRLYRGLLCNPKIPRASRRFRRFFRAP